jgi:starvation-inducible outer membrane lipoprotein
MKKSFLLLAVALPLMLSSCATPPPRQAYHNGDSSALIVQSLDTKTCQVIAPAPLGRVEKDRLLTQAKTFPQHQTAVVILENYTEPQLGSEFRDRSVDWFVGLRGLGYQHIVFLKGTGATDPNGLLTLAEYD